MEFELQHQRKHQLPRVTTTPQGRPGVCTAVDDRVFTLLYCSAAPMYGVIGLLFPTVGTAVGTVGTVGVLVFKVGMEARIIWLPNTISATEQLPDAWTDVSHNYCCPAALAGEHDNHRDTGGQTLRHRKASTR